MLNSNMSINANTTQASLWVFGYKMRRKGGEPLGEEVFERAVTPLRCLSFLTFLSSRKVLSKLLDFIPSMVHP
jgi:hypothetical protein